TMQIRPEMKPKSKCADKNLQQEHGVTKPAKSGRRIGDEQREEEAKCKGATNHGNPFRPVEKGIGCVIGQTENEVASETARRKNENPLTPLATVVRDHAIHQCEATESQVCKRRCKRCRVCEAF